MPMTVPTRNVKKRTRSMSPMTSISCNSVTEDEAAVCKNAIETNNRQTAIKALDCLVAHSKDQAWVNKAELALMNIAGIFDKE